MIRIINISILLFFSFWARAQNVPEIKLFARVVDDEILLRWGANDLELIEEGQKNGFVLTKISSNQTEMDIQKFVIKMDAPSTWQPETKEAKIIKEAYTQIKNPGNRTNIEQIHVERNTQSIILLMADLSIEAARLTALGMIDEKVKQGVDYVYTLSIAGNNSVSPSSIKINLLDEYKLPVIKDITANGLNEKINLTWDYTKLIDTFSCYIVERSKDQGRSYERTSEAPFLPLINYDMDIENYIATYEDDSLINNTSYYYRVAGVDIFGQKSAFSDPVKVTPKPPPLAIPASFDRIICNDDGEFEISWYLRDKWEDQVKGFYLLRSTDGKKSYQKVSELLAPSQRNFKDLSPNNICFYKIVTIDINDHVIPSAAGFAQKRDNEPPAAPLWGSGYIDTTGAVHLTWEENTEEDLGGYHVFFANSPDAEFSKLTNSAELEVNSYVDTIELKTLTKEIYYRLMAIDYRGNQSPYSEPLKLIRPDLIPPRAPDFKRCEQEIDKNVIRFASSSSSDIKSSYLQRKAKDKEWETIFSTSEKGKNKYFADTTALCTQNYQYRLVAEDVSGLTSTSDTINMKCVDSGKRPSIDKIEVVVDNRNITLEWDYKYYAQLKSIMIFREKEGDKMRKVKQMWKNEITHENRSYYIDNDVREGETYSYKVILRFVDNGFAQSPKTEFVTFKTE